MELTLAQKGKEHKIKHQCHHETVENVRRQLDAVPDAGSQQKKVYLCCELFENVLLRQCGLSLVYRNEPFRNSVIEKLKELASDETWGQNFEGFLQLAKRIVARCSLETKGE